MSLVLVLSLLINKLFDDVQGYSAIQVCSFLTSTMRVYELMLIVLYANFLNLLFAVYSCNGTQAVPCPFPNFLYNIIMVVAYTLFASFVVYRFLC